MYCKNCGNQIDDNAVVCIHCGHATENQQASQSVQTTNSGESNTIAIVGFVFAFLFPLVGLICSIIGLKKSKELGGAQKGLATAGIVVSVIIMIIEIIVIAFYASIIIALITGAANM